VETQAVSARKGTNVRAQAGGGHGHGYSRTQLGPPAAAFFYHTCMWHLRAVLRPGWLGLQETGQLRPGCLQPSSDCPHLHRSQELAGTHLPRGIPRPRGKGRTDPRRQCLALVLALPALCIATRTWAPTLPQSMASRLCQGESSLSRGAWIRHYTNPHPRPPACLASLSLPCLCHSLRTWLGVVALSCHGPRPTLGALRQPVWGTDGSPGSWAHSLLSITRVSASPST